MLDVIDLEYRYLVNPVSYQGVGAVFRLHVETIIRGVKHSEVLL